MSMIRQPAVAGMFYSADANTLKRDIQHYLEQVEPFQIGDMDDVSTNNPKVIVVPHAGYVYSGPVAASAYKLLIPLKHQINRVVLLGPSHQVAFKGMAVPEAEMFNTPLGNIPIDQVNIQLLSELPQVMVSDIAHRDEHSLEVQLPFLQETLDNFILTPIVVGDVESSDVAEVINRLWGDEHTLIVISTDLSHYHNYNLANQLDRATSDAIVGLKPDLISYESACGRNGLKGMMVVAKQKKLVADVLDLRNSGDTWGAKNRVVGYGAYAFH